MPQWKVDALARIILLIVGFAIGFLLGWFVGYDDWGRVHQ